MTRVIIQPCSNPDAQRHYADTVARPVAFKTLAAHLPASITEALHSIYGDHPIPTWGATPGKNDANVSQWNAMSAGDIALFTRKKKAFSSGRVTLKARNAALARQLWGKTDDGLSTWEYIYFLDDITPRDIDYPTIRRAAGLADKWNPLRFWTMDDTKSRGVLQLLNDNGSGDSHLAGSTDDIRRNVLTFNAEAASADRTTIGRLLTGTTYWVYDPMVDLFCPSKFAGIRDISMERYAALRSDAAERDSVPGFDGFASRRVIERVLQRDFEPDAILSDRLEIWATELMGDWPFGGVDRGKWLFLTIPKVEAGLVRFSAKGKDVPATDLAPAIKAAVSAGDFDPANVTDGREKVLAAITRRRGQPAFRKMMLAAYQGRCAVTGCDAAAALEAAHVTPYLGPQTNHPLNGVLLRSDIHTLFDLGLLAINVKDMTILVAQELKRTVYGELAGKQIHNPVDPLLRPSRDCLEQHLAGSKCKP